MGSGDVVRVYLRWGICGAIRGKNLDGLADIEGVEEGTVVDGNGIVGTRGGLNTSAKGVLDGVLAGWNVDSGHAGVPVRGGGFCLLVIVDGDGGRDGPGGDSDGEVKGFRGGDLIRKGAVEGVVGITGDCDVSAVAQCCIGGGWAE